MFPPSIEYVVEDQRDCSRVAVAAGGVGFHDAAAAVGELNLKGRVSLGGARRRWPGDVQRNGGSRWDLKTVRRTGLANCARRSGATAQ